MKSDIVEENYIVHFMAPEKWEVLFPFWQPCCIHPKGRISFSSSSSERFVAEMLFVQSLVFYTNGNPKN